MHSHVCTYLQIFRSCYCSEEMHYKWSISFDEAALFFLLPTFAFLSVTSANRWCVVVTRVYNNENYRSASFSVSSAFDTSPIPTACIHGRISAIVARTLSPMSYNSRHKLFADSPRVQCPWQWRSQCQPRSPCTYTWSGTFGIVPAANAHRFYAVILTRDDSSPITTPRIFWAL